MDDCEQPAEPTVGKAEAGTPDCEYPVAVLWLPDPTTRSGWCDRWVERKKAEKRQIGYRGTHSIVRGGR